MGNPQQPATPAPDQPSRVSQVRTLLNQKILALSEVLTAPKTNDDLAESAEDEINLCQTWVSALDATDPVTLPSPAQDQALLDAIQKVQSAVDTSADLNALITATAALINAFKAPA